MPDNEEASEAPQRGQTDHDKRTGSDPQTVLHRGESVRLLNQRIMQKDPQDQATLTGTNYDGLSGQVVNNDSQDSLYAFLSSDNM